MVGLLLPVGIRVSSDQLWPVVPAIAVSKQTVRQTAVPFAPGLWRKQHEVALGLRSAPRPPVLPGRCNPRSCVCSQNTSPSLQPPFLLMEQDADHCIQGFSN